ncbi:MAG: FkbM family methyltransferase [Zavarzinella sp.]
MLKFVKKVIKKLIRYQPVSQQSDPTPPPIVPQLKLAQLRDFRLHGSSRWDDTGAVLITSPNIWDYGLEADFDLTTTSTTVMLSVEGEILHGEIAFCLIRADNEIDSMAMIPHGVRNPRVLFHKPADAKSILVRNVSSSGESHIRLTQMKLEPFSLDLNTGNAFDLQQTQLSRDEARFWNRFYGTESPPRLEQYRRHRIFDHLQQATWVTWREGVQIKIAPGNETSRALFVSGNYEPVELAVLESLVSTGMMVVDIGANQGIYTTRAASLVGATGKVVAIEPSEREFQRLTENIQKNQFSQVSPFAVALSNQEGEATLLISQENHSGHNTLAGSFSYVTTHSDGLQVVPLKRLDDLLPTAGVGKVDFIKIDVEGAELSAFQGGRAVLERDHPVILFEATAQHLGKMGVTTDQLFGFLAELGYRFLRFDPTTFTWVPVPGYQSGSEAYVAVPAKNSEQVASQINNYLQKTYVDSATDNLVIAKSMNSSDGLDIGVFFSSDAIAINEARLEHLASLKLDLRGKTVLEVGGGPGHHTCLLEDLGGNVLLTDARADNLEDAVARHPHRKTAILDLNDCPNIEQLGKFDAIYCYGTLYHLEKPQYAIEQLAKVGDMIMMETCLCTAHDNVVEIVGENKDNPNQASSGLGCRPARAWVMDQLRKNFGYSYIAIDQPNHIDFNLEWETPPEAKNYRAIFVGSRTPIQLPKLVTDLPMHQQFYRYLNVKYLEVETTAQAEAALPAWFAEKAKIKLVFPNNADAPAKRSRILELAKDSGYVRIADYHWKGRYFLTLVPTVSNE